MIQPQTCPSRSQAEPRRPPTEKPEDGSSRGPPPGGSPRPEDGFLSRVVERVTNGIVITDARGTIEYTNRAFQAMTGYGAGELLGANPRVLKSGRQPPEFYREMWAELGAGRPFTTIFENQRRNGEVYFQKSTISPVRDEHGSLRYVGVTEDVTRARIMEEQVRRTHKLEALGQFTGSIAHDFNNILAVLMGSLELLALDLPGGDESRELVDEAMLAAEQGRELVDRLMAYVRDQSFVSRTQRVAPVLERATRLIRRLLPDEMHFIARLDADQAVCSVDGLALDQIFMNLATNARDAMSAGGTLILSAKERAVPGQFCALTVPHLHVCLADDGSGMDPGTAQRIFDPFFTTKGSGKGTGLGLAVTTSLVSAMGGGITVETCAGEGTTFHICLPQEET